MQIIGHRGAKGLAAENTLKSIRLSLQHSVDWVEFDVRVTKDNALVVVHDRTLLRVAKQRGAVAAYTLSEIRAIATRSGEQIPTFEDVIKAIGTKAKIDIELKSAGAAASVVTEIQRQVRNGRNYGDFIVSSFRPKLLRQIQRLDKQIPLLLLHSVWPFTFMFTPRLRLSAVGFWRFMTPKIAVARAKKKHMWVAIYTVNYQYQVKRFELLGADALITDYPNAFLSRRNWWLKIFAWIILVLLLLLGGYIAIM